MATASIATELTCSICLELFEDPISLPCMHSFCKGCLYQMYVSKSTVYGKMFDCPACRRPVQLSNTGIEGLPRNFTLANIVENYLKNAKENNNSSVSGTNLMNEENGEGWPDAESDEEIYDDYNDATSNVDPLRDYPWYFGEIERYAGNRYLKDKAGNGTYLVRRSARGGDDQPYTLMVMYNDHIFNVKVRFDNKKRFALGEEKYGDITFKTVPDLISHHQKNVILIVPKSGARYQTVLKTTPKKP